MSIKKSNKANKFNKAFSMRFRFLATVICAMLAITVFIGGLSLYEVDNYVQTQAEDFVKVTCENEGTQINDSLRNMEKSVKIMESYLMDFFSSKTDIENSDIQKQVIEKADQMFVDVANHTSTSGAIAYYFRFDPSISDGRCGLFYSKLNGGSEFVSLEPTDITIYDKNDTEHVGWFWQPYEAGKPIWMKPYHNQNNDIWMISYVIPMYYDDQFIGIVGMDFDYVVLSEQVHGIKLYENGFAHLEIDGELICDEVHNKTEQIDLSDKYLRTSHELVNGMTLVLSASYDDISSIRHDITFEILFVVIVLAILFTVIAVFAVKKIVEPLNKLTNASAKLANGEYDVEIIQSNTYEIRMLSNAFENMATRLRERENLLHLIANRDSLTGLRNTTSYATWIAKFDKAIADKNAEFGIIVLDLNDLKETNDKYGHAAGNKLIVSAAKVIADIYKNSLVFRIGGDEFVVILQSTDLENYEKLSVEFENMCANTFVEEENAKLSIKIASGFARFEQDKDSNFNEVFRRADNAMYENKSKSKHLSL